MHRASRCSTSRGQPRTKNVVLKEQVTNWTWFGFDNFRRLVSDRQVREAVYVTAVFVLVAVPLELVLGLLLALLVWGFGCQALNVGMVFLPVSSSSRWRQPSRGLVHDVPRGARPLARIIAPQACIRWTRGDPDHDAAMRIGGEAPGRRAHSSTRHESHRKARVTATSDRHRQPAGEPWADRETVSAALLRPSPLTPPDAGRHRPASRRWSPNATAR